MITLHSESDTDTKAIAGAIASVLEPGDIVVLDGGLGAGKTTFVQGAVRALGSDAAVTSPTFAIVQQYRGARMPIAHVDAYRLERVQELHDIGFDELFDGSTVVFVEWGERIRAALPDDTLTVRLDLSFDAGDDERVLSVHPRGAAWAARAMALAQALAQALGWTPSEGGS